MCKLSFVLLVLTLQTSFAGGQSRILTVDLSDKGDTLIPFWASFGYDEPNYTYTPEGRRLLKNLAGMGKATVYVRTHNLLTSGDGTPALKWGSTNAYALDSAGRPAYDWRILDSIFDTYHQAGVKPIAEIGFMPEALSSHPQPYRHHWQPGSPYAEIYTGWSYPPEDGQAWAELVYAWVRHAVERYGAPEVRSWWWEVWNEPDIGYWHGSAQEYYRLYDLTAAAVKRACPGARVGGPASTGPGGSHAAAFLRGFLEHCASGKNAVTGETGTALDFISFHAKGHPRIVDGRVRMDMGPALRDLSEGFRLISLSAFPSLPVLVTECDPEGCAACGMATQPENAYRNGLMYASYTADVFSRLYDLAAAYEVNLVRATSWSFTFPGQPWFNGLRSLATHGIGKPVLNVFRMLSMMQGRRVTVTDPFALPADTIIRRGVHGGAGDIVALASATEDEAWVLLCHYYDADQEAPPDSIRLRVRHVGASRVRITHYRIDEHHSNSYAAWKSMGSPPEVDQGQYRVLAHASQLGTLGPPRQIRLHGDSLDLAFPLPRQGVSLLRLQLAP